MIEQSALMKRDIVAYLEAQEKKELLRFITCGSVDDGKSSLIGRLLYESKLIYEDQLVALEKDSKKHGTIDNQIDFALLVDGLAAEREQGITIDVAYRFFSTDKRKFIVADTPGHEQYTRNMATGASTADLAVLMIDARKGVLTQTRRHSKIVQLLGVQNIVLAINKMDLVDYSQRVFEQIKEEYMAFAKQLGLRAIVAIPVSAIHGDNITKTSTQTPWYTGPTLMQHLESAALPIASKEAPFSMPVQWVNRPHLDFRGFAGQVTTGSIKPGDAVVVHPSRAESIVDKIITFDGALNEAQTGQSITLTLRDEIDISRGDVITATTSPVKEANRFKSTLLWMTEAPLVAGQVYWLKIRAKVVSATLSTPQYRLDINTLNTQPAATLQLNEIGCCTLTIDQDIAYEPYQKNPHLGSCILIDRRSNATVAMGLFEEALDHHSWIERYMQQRKEAWVDSKINAQQRADRYGHDPMLIVCTGHGDIDTLTHVQCELEERLFNKGFHVYRQNRRPVTSTDGSQSRQDSIRLLLDMSTAFLNAGLVYIVALPNATRYEREAILKACRPQHRCDILDLDQEQDLTDIVARYSALLSQ